jgi:hypothetical protein
MKKNFWSDTVESSTKDVECCFGILKKIWRCLINPLELQYPYHHKRLFTVCAILSIILLNYDGIDEWEKMMKNSKFDVNDDNVDLNYI